MNQSLLTRVHAQLNCTDLHQPTSLSAELLSNLIKRVFRRYRHSTNNCYYSLITNTTLRPDRSCSCSQQDKSQVETARKQGQRERGCVVVGRGRDHQGGGEDSRFSKSDRKREIFNFCNFFRSGVRIVCGSVGVCVVANGKIGNSVLCNGNGNRAAAVRWIGLQLKPSMLAVVCPLVD